MSKLHMVEHRRDGRALTEEDHAQRIIDQGERVADLIAEIMDGDAPLEKIFTAKLAHRGLGFDSLFDESIEALKEAFQIKPEDIKNASMAAIAREQDRKKKIRASAKNAALRAGYVVEDNGDDFTVKSEEKKIDVATA